jgi:hypothetical protein
MADDPLDMAKQLFDTLAKAGKGTINVIKDAAEAYTDLATTITSQGEIAEKIGIGKLIYLQEQLQETYVNMVKPALYFENRLKSLNKNFGITSKAANILNASLAKQANEYGISTEQVIRYASNLKKLYPTLKQNEAANNASYQGLQQVQHVLTQNLQLSDEQANAYSLYAQQNGQNAAEALKVAKLVTKSATGIADISKDTTGTFKMITEEIANAGSVIQLQYGKIPGRLEAAVLKAKKFGFTLQQVTSIGDKMLDIESSTSDELEYQLLTGRRLVDQDQKSLTQKFREAALTGNAVKQGEALNQIIEQEGDTLEKNLFARKQMAKLLGIQEQELAAALQKKKILEKAESAGITVDIDDQGSLEEAAQQLVKTGKMTKDEFEQFQKDIDTRTTEDILKQQLDVQKEALMMTYLTNENISDQVRQSVLKGAMGIEGYDEAIRQGQDLSGIAAAFMIQQAGRSALSTAQGFSQGQAKDAGDVVSMPGSVRTLTSEYGEIFNLDRRDAVLAGPAGALLSGMGSGNNKDVVAAIQHLERVIVTAMLTRPEEGINI